MKPEFDKFEAVKMWTENHGIEGWYCEDGPCGCTAEGLCHCGVPEDIINGDCVPGVVKYGDYQDADGNACDWLVFPDDR